MLSRRGLPPAGGTNEDERADANQDERPDEAPVDSWQILADQEVEADEDQSAPDEQGCPPVVDRSRLGILAGRRHRIRGLRLHRRFGDDDPGDDVREQRNAAVSGTRSAQAMRTSAGSALIHVATPAATPPIMEFGDLVSWPFISSLPRD